MIIDDINKYIIEADYVGGPKTDASGAGQNVNITAKHAGEISIVSGDMFDAEMKHRLENFDKEQTKAILESKDIVQAYNDFVQLKIDNILHAEGKYKNFEDAQKIFQTFAQVYKLADQFGSLTTNLGTTKGIIDGFVYTDQDPKFIRALLEARLEYCNTTQKLLKKIIENNATILKLSSSQIQALISGSDADNVKDLKEAINKNKDQFIKNKYLIDCKDIGAGVMVTGEGFEIGEVVKFEDYIQDLVNYDLVVLAHGSDSSMSPRIEEKLKQRAINKIPKSLYGRLKHITAKEVSDLYDKITEHMQKSGGILQSLPEMSDREQLIYALFAKSSQKGIAKEKKHANWEFTFPITGPDNKSYISVPGFVKAMKQKGYNKIKLYSCNPGEFDLPADLKPGVVFSKRTNWVENNVYWDTTDDIINESTLDEVYELEQLALDICQENGIDYNDNEYLTECMNYVANNSEILNEENIVVKGLKALIELCKKVIGAIVGFIKAIINAIMQLIEKIKAFIKNKDARKMKNKQVEVSVIAMEGAKIKTAKVSSQEELYKAVEASINSVSKEYRKVADKQSKINKELQMQLERADKKMNNENASVYDKILNNTVYS